MQTDRGDILGHITTQKGMIWFKDDLGERCSKVYSEEGDGY